ncbi:hypothetical protein M0R45_036413 [Rubus argutus]|uniref:Uncharacterized protein n=1 Tax=Rubus argutus TaxID=59490 RepID=A0AAW1VZJ1_RUBAR
MTCSPSGHSQLADLLMLAILIHLSSPLSLIKTQALICLNLIHPSLILLCLQIHHRKLQQLHYSPTTVDLDQFLILCRSLPLLLHYLQLAIAAPGPSSSATATLISTQERPSSIQTYSRRPSITSIPTTTSVAENSHAPIDPPPVTAPPLPPKHSMRTSSEMELFNPDI